MRTLLMLSGGLDSTCALIKLLKETKDELYVHHLDSRNFEGRYQAESIAINRILPFGLVIRKFFYTQSLHDFTKMKLFAPTDIHLSRFVASQICVQYKIDQFATGECKDDFGTPGYLTRKITGDIFFNVLAKDTKVVYPVIDMTKKEEIEYLKNINPDILKHIHYCRRPEIYKDEWYNCGKCRTCKQTKSADENVYNYKIKEVVQCQQ
jgi:7-cyano-7-deazaguanine synthase in queuosine biosynthesis